MTRKIVIAFIGVGATVGLYFLLLGEFVPDSWRMRLSQQKRFSAPHLCSTDFQVVENGTAFVYSAYVDDRPARDFPSDPNSTAAVVRIFTYFMRTMDVRRNWKCLFWYADHEEPVVVSISGVTDLNKEASDLRFMVAMVLCNLPEILKSSDLQGISLASTDINATNFVCVTDLRRSGSDTFKQSNPTSFIPFYPTPYTPFYNLTGKIARLENETAKGEPEQRRVYNTTFTVCTTPIHGSHYTVNDIVNFCEISRILGAEKFIFYVDANLDQSVRYCLESYVERGLIEMYPFTPPVLDDLHYHGQIVAITDCAYRTMYRTKYLINQDLDELIVPVKAENWLTLLNVIHRRISFENAERIAVYSFQNQFFPMEAVDDAAYSEKYLVKRYNIKAILKTMKDPYILPHHSRSKVMARPERVLIWHVHLIREENLVRTNDTIYLAEANEALLYHYRSSTGNGNLTIERRMFEYADLVTERIHFGMGYCSLNF